MDAVSPANGCDGATTATTGSGGRATKRSWRGRARWDDEAGVARAVQQRCDDRVRMRVTHLDAALEGLERAQHQRDDPMRERRVDRQPQTGRVFDRTQSLCGIVEKVDRALGVRQKGITRRRQRGPPGRTVKEPASDLVLQSCHAIADGGLGDQQGARRPAEASFPDDREEHGDIVCLYGHKQIL